MKPRFAYGILFVCTGLISTLVGADPSPTVEALPSLSNSESWTVVGQSLEVTSEKNRLDISFSGPPGTEARLLLREPQPIPAWASGFTMILGNRGGEGRVKIRAVVEDEEGTEFLYRLLPPLPDFQEGYPVFKVGFRNIPQRLQMVGLKRPKLGNGDWDTISGPRGRSPKGKLVVKGLLFENATKANSLAKLTLSEFAWTRLVPKESALYYALNGREGFGELDPAPFIYLADLGRHTEGTFDVRWEARSAFEGAPIMKGQKTFRLDKIKSDTQLDQKIEFPLRETGAYWITVKLRDQRDGDSFPRVVEEKVFRLDIIHSKQKNNLTQATPNPAQITIGVGRQLLAYDINEELVLPVRFQVEGPASEYSYRITARPFAGWDLVKELKGTLSPSQTTIDLDLSDQNAGAWVVRAELRREGRLIDVSERLVGKRGAAANTSPQAPVYTGPTDPTEGKAKFPFFPHIPDGERDDPEKRWLALKPLLDQAAAVTTSIELPLRWKDVEPMPGIYDWTWVDRVMEYAASKGLTIILHPGFVGSEPEWIPSYFSQNAEGAVFGHHRYLFQGMRANFWQAQPLRQAVLDWFSALAARYANHPACEGYLILTEHPGEYPVAGWYDGFDPETLTNFREAIQKKWEDLATVNERWGTSFQNWEQISVPEEGSSSRQYLDWMRFRREAISNLLLDELHAVRREDGKGLVEMYTDGLDAEHYAELRRMGCILANGGVNEPELHSLQKASVAAYGLQERAEERTVGQWAAYGPHQLEGTLFSMLQGGGGNSHCKMFIPSKKSFAELEADPHALARYKKLMPVWKELRQTEAPKREMFILNDLSARLLAAQSTAFVEFGDSSTTRSFLESQLVPPVAEIDKATSGKLLFCVSSLGTSYEADVIEKIVHFVKEGGTLVMTADAGRRSSGLPGQDWVLLQKLGFPAPSERAGQKARARTQTSSIFPGKESLFTLAGPLWNPATEGSGETVAQYEGTPATPAISWKDVGHGRVAVLWASRLVPPADDENAGYLYLADLARWAGIALPSNASHPRIYTNLLKHEGKDTFYGLAYHSGSHMPWGREGTAREISTRWQVPEGRYEITEVLSGKALGTFDAESLRSTGLQGTINQHEVLIYRMERIGESPAAVSTSTP
jgi:hypothetical protein